jgi:hypothetical protein
LIDIVVADENLHAVLLFDVPNSGGSRTTAQMRDRSLDVYTASDR